MKRKILETSSFLELYVHACGQSIVPREFNIWSCLSLMAAVLEDRVFVEIYKRKPLFPNMYVLLLGPSGSGKGLAIETAVDLVESSLEPHRVMINKFRGRITAPRLVDRLGGKAESPNGDGPPRMVIDNAKLWLVMDELRNDIHAGGKQMIEDFFTMMTELYTGHYVFNTGTRMYGDVDVNKACVNWLAGTTQEWLRKVINRDMAHSGFIPRLMTVRCGYSRKKLHRPVYPDDEEEVTRHLQARLWGMRYMQGQFVVTPQALAREARWYMDRKIPKDAVMRPLFQRQQAMLYKIAMLLAISDGGPLVIRHHHVAMAIKIIGMYMTNAERLIAAASGTDTTRDVEKVAERVKAEGVITRTDLLKSLRTRGFGAERLTKALTTLLQSGEVEAGKMGRTTAYSWSGGDELVTETDREI
jgi:hypothetical protein